MTTARTQRDDAPVAPARARVGLVARGNVRAVPPEEAVAARRVADGEGHDRGQEGPHRRRWE